MTRQPPGRIAVIGAGIAGTSCAHALAAAGQRVQVFDKARGVGGRLATRRAEWIDAAGLAQPARFDHGAPAFSARGGDFQRFLDQACRSGLVAPWLPRAATAATTPPRWVATPAMPALCRALLAGLPVQIGCRIDAVRHDGLGWRLACEGRDLDEPYATVVLAIPPAQAAALLQAAAPTAGIPAATLQPGWVLMASSEEIPGLDWALAQPSTGPLALVVRDDGKPGRQAPPGHAHWVAHARSDWSRERLESAPDAILPMLQSALAEVLGAAPRWRHAAVHRWRYATVAPGAAVTQRCAWDAARGLGLCGDAFGSGGTADTPSGVEDAWRSGRALAAAILADATR